MMGKCCIKDAYFQSALFSNKKIDTYRRNPPTFTRRSYIHNHKGVIRCDYRKGFQVLMQTI